MGSAQQIIAEVGATAATDHVREQESVINPGLGLKLPL
jgi:hypothetical protein